MLNITETHTQVLEALARYKYLTVSQLQRIGISRSKQVLWREVKKLANSPTPLVGIINFPPNMRVEKVERVHYLTEDGAMVLADILGMDFEELDFQRVTSVYHRDYWHRKYSIDFHIWLTQALASAPWDLEICLFDRYFDKIGANRTNNPKATRLRAKTRFDLSNDRYIIPDVNFVLQSASQPARKAFYCMEMCNGKDTKRILTQLYKHTVAMQEGVIAQHYGLAQNYRVLLLFSKPGAMEAVLKRFSEIDRGGFQQLVFLGLVEHAERDVLRCWRQPHHEGLVNFVTGKVILE